MSEIVSTNNFFQDKYLSNYNNFITQLKVIFSGDETQKKLGELESLSDNEKVIRGILFTEAILDEHFTDFTKSKIKVFSHKSPDTQKISESLFGHDFCLKNLLNNQPDEVKTIIWSNLHNILLVSELLKPEADRNTNRITTLSKIVFKNEPEPFTENECEQTQTKYSNASSNAKSKLKDMLGVEVNDETTGMIDDIVASFEGILTGATGSGANPFAGIMEVSQKISVKYADKINKGEIELDKLMKSISKKVPGMESMLGGMMGGASGEKSKPKEKIIIDENFSTADVAVGINKEEDKPSINIGNVLKMADQFGVIPGGKQSESGIPDLSALGGLAEMGDIPNLGKVMEIMQKLEKTETKEEADALKQEMDIFLQKELNIDVDKLNKDLESVQNQMSNTNN